MNDFVYVCARACHCHNVYTFVHNRHNVSYIVCLLCVCVTVHMMDFLVEHVVGGFLGRRGDRRGLSVHMPLSAAPSTPPSFFLLPFFLFHFLNLFISLSIPLSATLSHAILFWSCSNTSLKQT